MKTHAIGRNVKQLALVVQSLDVELQHTELSPNDLQGRVADIMYFAKKLECVANKMARRSIKESNR